MSTFTFVLIWSMIAWHILCLGFAFAKQGQTKQYVYSSFDLNYYLILIVLWSVALWMK